MPTPTSPLRELFDIAVTLDPPARDAFLDARCPDAEMRTRLERMLAPVAPEAAALPPVPATALASAIGDADDEHPVLLPGTRIGPFELLGVLGEGGSATVFHAVRDSEGVRQEVALKVLHRSLHSHDARRQFRRERLALTQLRHPGIARLIEGGVTETGLAFIALELVNGEPITDHARAHTLDRPARLRLFVQVCRAVDAAHRALIVHRDLKPSNVLVDDDGAVKVLDFGIAKLLESEDDPTQTVQSFTPAYAAPEQREAAPVTTATDVYALGVLLGELLTGQRLGADGKRAATATMPRTDPPLRGDLDNVLRKALAFEPERRYASAGTLGDDIERWLEGLPVVAHPPSHRYRMRKFIQRHKTAVGVTATLLLALLGTLGFALWQANVARAESQRAHAVKDFLVGIFDAAKANLPRNERPTPETLVREASRRARDDTSIEPALRNDLLRTLGIVSLSMGDYAQAEALLDETLRGEDAAGVPADARERLDTLVRRATLLQRTNRNDQADALLSRILPQLRRRNDDVAANGLMLHAVTRLYAGHPDEATSLAREAAWLAAQRFPPASIERIKIESFPGQLAANLRHWQEAASQLEPIITRWRALGVPLDIEFARALGNLATAKGRLGDRVGAEALYRENIALRRRIYADRPNDALASALEVFAIFLMRQDGFDEAQTLLNEALTINTQVLGPDNTEVASTIETLGTLEAAQRQFEASEKHLRAALTMYEAHVATAGEQDNDRAFTQMHLAQTLIERAQYVEAAQLADRALQSIRATSGDDSELTASAYAVSARVALAGGDIASETADAGAAATILAARDSAPSLAAIAINCVHAQVSMAQQRYEAALADTERALSAARSITPDSHSRIAGLLALRARAQRALGRDEAAQRSIDEARALGVPSRWLSDEDVATLASR